VLTPIVAEKDIAAETLTIRAGQARGVQQIGRGIVGGAERITLLFRAAIGEPDPHDSVTIDGVPAFTSTIPGGIHGDIATCAITLNAVPVVLAAPPGLRTMADVPPASFFAASDHKP